MKAAVAICSASLTARMALVERLQSRGVEAEAFASEDALLTHVRQKAVAAVVLNPVNHQLGLEIIQAARANGDVCPVIAWNADFGRVLAASAVEDVQTLEELDAIFEHVVTRFAADTAETRPILVIDDSVTFRETLAEALEREGFPVQKASSAEAGLRLAAEVRPRAFVVDGFLPGMDGASFIRRIKLDQAYARVPCILLTGARGRDAEVQALDSGADAFVRKDEGPEVVLAKLVAIIRPAWSDDGVLEGHSPLGGRRILAVDDSITYRAQLAEALTEEGYVVLQAGSGHEALAVLAREQVDCVLLDLMMPDLDGREVCRQLKASEAFREIPVLLLTGLEDRSAMLEGLAIGADDYIQKSSELEVLKARLRAQLRRRQYEEQARSIREQLMQREVQETEARAALSLAETRARLVDALEQKNQELQNAYAALKEAQTGYIHAAKMASLGELVAGVAHEINNPLAFVTSHLQTALGCLSRCEESGAPLNDACRPHWVKAQTRLNEMKLGLGRISNLVVKLRTFSRLDEGERKIVSIQECVDSVITILSHRLGNGILVTQRLLAPDDIDCYPALLNQALLNLLTNAIDAVEGSGRIEINTWSEAEGCVLEVADDGYGIPEEHLGRVLEPFYTTKDVGQGTGLGLSITYSIAKRHGGTLCLSSGQPRGTRVQLRIPLQLSEP